MAIRAPFTTHNANMKYLSDLASLPEAAVLRLKWMVVSAFFV